MTFTGAGRMRCRECERCEAHRSGRVFTNGLQNKWLGRTCRCCRGVECPAGIVGLKNMNRRLYGIDPADSVFHQRSRLLRLAAVAGGVGLHLLFCTVLMGLGYLQISTPILLILAGSAMLTYGVLALAISLEWNLLLEDPDMALVKMLIASTVVITTALCSSHSQALVVCGGLALIVVGASRLQTRELFVFAIYSFGLLAIPLLGAEGLNAMSGLSAAVMLLTVVALVFIGPLLYRFESDGLERRLQARGRELRQAQLQIEQLSRVDPETGAYKQAASVELLNSHRAMTARQSYTFSVCHLALAGLPHADSYFSESGHKRILRQIVDISTSILREVDHVARIGDEEFLLVLGGTDWQSATQVAQRFSQRLAAFNEFDDQLQISASIGIAEYSFDESLASLLKRAATAATEALDLGPDNMVTAGHRGGDSSALAYVAL
ncbi:MAG: diguanylate cyclase (GGDEF)-like protein [Candidatus Azotimanducaceae bacterium]|jgi:diguanylate cyclase (GGDEF)-like protein